MPAEMPKAYEPADVESRWYAFWMERGVFRATSDASDTRPVYVIPMPPPNVTGALHMGHALTAALEDVLTRWHRMRGYNTLWLPGIDHAGISTQIVVERQLKREGVTRHELGREKFIERVWQWKAESGGRIALQQRELGASPDWERSKYTMDPDMVRAVTEAFVRLYEDGLIYRATRLINWCVSCQTVLSDLEVESEENVNGELFEFAYPVEGTNEEIVVATTRPETMLGDTAVAVHPDDPRYRHLHGKMLVHPFVDRKIPIITDAILVDPKFGTGAVKVTPAHDPNDFATGKRHGLAEITIFANDGTMNENGGPFRGLDRKEARKRVKRELEQKGLARGSKAHLLTLPKCQRCATVVEPMISTQWFVKMKPLAEPALAAVADGRTRIIPEEWVKTYNHFLENIQDWCISRQLWWGHQIPAWFCVDGHCTVAREKPAACGECKKTELTQDSDVLDTWFSSGLWPFATQGWPDKTPALAKFYPATDLETGYDIIFFWVARMMMLGLYFMKDVPFRRVLLHGMVVDENGDKMAKTRGNGLDPLDLIHGASFDQIVEKALPGAPHEEALAKFKKSYPSAAQMGTGFPAFGADALRFTFNSYSPQAKRILLAPKRIEGYRHFCNKVWNAVRFALPYLETHASAVGAMPQPTWRANRWILSRLAAAIAEVDAGLTEFRLDEASGALYRFFWDDFCSWYLEIVKPVFLDEASAVAGEVAATLAHVLETSMRALHPFMPFITEELWQRLPRPASRPVSIAIAPFPSAADGIADPEADREMALLTAAISAARTIRSEHEVHPGAQVPLVLRGHDPQILDLFRSERVTIRTLVKTEGDPLVETSGGGRPLGSVMSVVGDVEVLVGLRGLVDAGKEADRVEREIRRADKDLASLEKKLGSPAFVERAKPEIVAEAKGQVEALRRTRARLEEARQLAGELA
ncbi:MAG TPA: valine--tRNA ligase [Polyangiaceae bacterium]|nr:valine--tRNA ligase [Polyangiaceae bacterium]